MLQHLYDQLVACGLLAPASRPAPAPFVSAAPQPPPPGAPILLHPGGRQPAQTLAAGIFPDGWRPGLEARGLQPAFLLGPAEADLAERLQHAAAPNRRLHCVADLFQLQQLLGAAGGLIGNDSGISHLSAFLGLPTVAVFGPSDAARWAPSGPAVTVLRSAPDCPRCFETAAENCQEAVCLSGTRPETVLKAFLTLYHRGLGQKKWGR